MKRCFVFTEGFERAEMLAAQMKETGGIELVCMMSEIPKTTAFIHSFPADMILLDGCANPWKIYYFGKLLIEEGISAKLVFMFNEMIPEIFEALKEVKEYCSILYMSSSISNPQVNQVETTFDEDNRKDLFEGNIDIKTTKIMEELGFPVHLKGFHYIRSGVLYLHHLSESIAMKILYREIARQYGTTSSRVEKTIRTSIDYAYRHRPNMIEIEGRKPTNSQVIHNIMMKLQALENKKERVYE